MAASDFWLLLLLLSLYVHVKSKVENYNKKLKQILVLKTNYNIQNSSAWLININIPNDGHLVTQCWDGK